MYKRDGVTASDRYILYFFIFRNFNLLFTPPPQLIITIRESESPRFVALMADLPFKALQEDAAKLALNRLVTGAEVGCSCLFQVFAKICVLCQFWHSGWGTIWVLLVSDYYWVTSHLCPVAFKPLLCQLGLFLHFIIINPISAPISWTQCYKPQQAWSKSLEIPLWGGGGGQEVRDTSYRKLCAQRF